MFMEWPIIQKSIILNKINGLGDVFEKKSGMSEDRCVWNSILPAIFLNQ